MMGAGDVVFLSEEHTKWLSSTKHTYIHHTYIHECTNIPNIYLDTYLHTYKHAYTQALKHTCMYAYIHTYAHICTCNNY